MDPLKNWPERYGDAFSEVCEVVRTVEIATRTRSGIAGETYRVELLRNLTSGECEARYEVLADGRWVPVNLGHAGRSRDADKALGDALALVAECAHSAR